MCLYMFYVYVYVELESRAAEKSVGVETALGKATVCKIP